MSSIVSNENLTKNVNITDNDSAAQKDNTVKNENINEEIKVEGDKENNPDAPPEDNPNLNPDSALVQSELAITLKTIYEQLLQTANVESNLEEGLSNITPDSDFPELLRVTKKLLDMSMGNQDSENIERDAMFELGRLAFNYVLNHIDNKNPSATIRQRKEAAKMLMSISETGVKTYDRTHHGTDDKRVKAREYMNNQDLVDENKSLNNFETKNVKGDNISADPVFETHLIPSSNVFKQKAFVGIRFTGYDVDKRIPVRRELRIGFKGSGIASKGQLTDESNTNAKASTATKVTDSKMGNIIMGINSKSGSRFNVFTHNSNHFVKEVAQRAGLRGIAQIHDAAFTSSSLKNMKKLKAENGDEIIKDPNGNEIKISTGLNEDRKGLYDQYADKIEQEDIEDIDPEIAQTILFGRNRVENMSVEDLTKSNMRDLYKKTAPNVAVGTAFLDKLSDLEYEDENSLNNLITSLIEAVSSTLDGDVDSEDFLKQVAAYSGERLGVSNMQLAANISILMLEGILSKTVQAKNNTLMSQITELKSGNLKKYDLNMELGITQKAKELEAKFENNSAEALIMTLRSRLEEAVVKVSTKENLTGFDAVPLSERGYVPAPVPAQKSGEKTEQSQNEIPNQYEEKKDSSENKKEEPVDSTDERQKARIMVDGKPVFSDAVTKDFVIAAFTINIKDETPASLIKRWMGTDRAYVEERRKQTEDKIKSHPMYSDTDEDSALVKEYKSLKEKKEKLPKGTSLSEAEANRFEELRKQYKEFNTLRSQEDKYTKSINTFDAKKEEYEKQYKAYREKVDFEDNLYLLSMSERAAAISFLPALADDFVRIDEPLKAESTPKEFVQLDEYRRKIEEKGISNGVKDIYYALRNFVHYYKDSIGKKMNAFLSNRLKTSHAELTKGISEFGSKEIAQFSSYLPIVQGIYGIITLESFTGVYNSILATLDPTLTIKPSEKITTPNKDYVTIKMDGATATIINTGSVSEVTQYTFKQDDLEKNQYFKQEAIMQTADSAYLDVIERTNLPDEDKPAYTKAFQYFTDKGFSASISIPDQQQPIAIPNVDMLIRIVHGGEPEMKVIKENFASNINEILSKGIDFAQKEVKFSEQDRPTILRHFRTMFNEYADIVYPFIAAKNNIGLGKGNNLSIRNVATKVMADLFGLGDIFVGAKMVNIETTDKSGNTTTKRGVLMEDSGGMSIGQIIKTIPDNGITGWTISATVKEDLLNMQLMDNINGQTDRHIENIHFKFHFVIGTRNEKDSRTGLDIAVPTRTIVLDRAVAIDNELAFGTAESFDISKIGENQNNNTERISKTEYEEGLDGEKKAVQKLAFYMMNKGVYEKVLSVKEEDIRTAIGNMIEDDYIQPVVDRVKAIQKLLKDTFDGEKGKERLYTEINAEQQESIVPEIKVPNNVSNIDEDNDWDVSKNITDATWEQTLDYSSGIYIGKIKSSINRSIEALEKNLKANMEATATAKREGLLGEWLALSKPKSSNAVDMHDIQAELEIVIAKYHSLKNKSSLEIVYQSLDHIMDLVGRFSRYDQIIEENSAYKVSAEINSIKSNCDSYLKKGKKESTDGGKRFVKTVLSFLDKTKINFANTITQMAKADDIRRSFQNGAQRDNIDALMKEISAETSEDFGMMSNLKFADIETLSNSDDPIKKFKALELILAKIQNIFYIKDFDENIETYNPILRELSYSLEEQIDDMNMDDKLKIIEYMIQLEMSYKELADNLFEELHNSNEKEFIETVKKAHPNLWNAYGEEIETEDEDTLEYMKELLSEEKHKIYTNLQFSASKLYLRYQIFHSTRTALSQASQTNLIDFYTQTIEDRMSGTKYNEKTKEKEAIPMNTPLITPSVGKIALNNSQLLDEKKLSETKTEEFREKGAKSLQVMTGQKNYVIPTFMEPMFSLYNTLRSKYSSDELFADVKATMDDFTLNKVHVDNDKLTKNEKYAYAASFVNALEAIVEFGDAKGENKKQRKADSKELLEEMKHIYEAIGNYAVGDKVKLNAIRELLTGKPKLSKLLYSK